MPAVVHRRIKIIYFNLFAVTDKIHTFAKIICSVERAKKYGYIDNCLWGICAKGGISSIFEELNRTFDFFGQVFHGKLLKVDNKIAIIHKNFYAMLPPKYSKNGWNYYIGLYTKISPYGTVLQQAMILK
jgi:hypothetical protein